MTEVAQKAQYESSLIEAYLVTGTVGNVGMPGAPIMHFSLVVVPGAHTASGTVEITQALASTNGVIVVTNVTGQIRPTGFGTLHRSLHLKVNMFKVFHLLQSVLIWLNSLPIWLLIITGTVPVVSLTKITM